MNLPLQQLEERVKNLEEVSKTLTENISSIANNIQAIRRDLIGSSDSLVEGALPDLRKSVKELGIKIELVQKRSDNLILLERDISYNSRRLDNITNDLEDGLLTKKEKEETLEFINVFKGSNKVLWTLLAIIPIIVTIVNVIIFFNK